MAFINVGYFPPNPTSGYCVPEIGVISEYTPLLSLTDAMYIWWKIYKIRYTYSWSYVSPTSYCSGSGSVLMDGGLQKMSDKICPQIIYYTCGQNVHYVNSYTPEDSTGDDQVTLAIDSLFYKYIEINPSTEARTIYYIPSISLNIFGFRGYDYNAWNNVDYEPDAEHPQGGFVNFFGLFTQPLYPTTILDDIFYSVSISLSVEEESQAQ